MIANCRTRTAVRRHSLFPMRSWEILMPFFFFNNKDRQFSFKKRTCQEKPYSKWKGLGILTFGGWSVPSVGRLAGQSLVRVPSGEQWPCGQTDQHGTAAEGKRAPRAVSAASSPGVGAAGAPQPREGALAPAGPTPGGPASLTHQAAGPARRLTSPRPSPFKGVSVTVPTSGDVAPSRPPCCARSCDLPHAQCLHCCFGRSDASGR